MKNREGPGLWRRLWTALGSALRRRILGKSSHDYMKQFTGGDDDYWDRAIAAQRGWPHKAPAPVRLSRSANALKRARPSVRDTAGRPSEPELQPVLNQTREDFYANDPAPRPRQGHGAAQA